MIPRLLSNRAVTTYAILWCIGFPLACAGTYFQLPFLKWPGYILLAPFSLYIALMTILSTISFIRALKNT
jgi:hypothetical protein